MGSKEIKPPAPFTAYIIHKQLCSKCHSVITLFCHLFFFLIYHLKCFRKLCDFVKSGALLGHQLLKTFHVIELELSSFCVLYDILTFILIVFLCLRGPICSDSGNKVKEVSLINTK